MRGASHQRILSKTECAKREAEPNPRARKELAEFKHAVDIRFPHMDEETRREAIEYAASIALAFVTGNIIGFLIFQALPKIMAGGGKPNAVAYNIARVLGPHVGEEQLRRRARIIQDLLLTMGPLTGIVMTAGGSIYAGLKGVLGW